MRNIFYVAIAVISAMVWVSCDPITTKLEEDDKPIETDKPVIPGDTDQLKPDLALAYFQGTDSENATDFTDALTCGKGDTYQVVVLDAIDTFTYSLYAADESVLSIKESSKGTWTILAIAPGLTDIQVTITQPDGKEWKYNYEVVVYGHISFESKCDPIERTAGFEIGDIEYEGLKANMAINTKVVGWPWSMTDQKYSVKLDKITQTLPLDSGEDLSYIIDLDAAFDEIYDLDYETNPNGEKAWWGPRQLQMDIVLSLNNSFIIVDDIIDDSDREMPDYINFETSVAFKQDGVYLASVSEEDGVDKSGREDYNIDINL